MSNVSTLKRESDFTQVVQNYWEDPSTVSLIDQNLLEIEKVSQYLRSEDHLLDIGCGDAKATIHYAQKVRSCSAIEITDDQI